ncbi:hypothetical protein EA462_09000 [Natrarchaeobius halalkaliphilus]|uniref:DUF8055 domain-containing protein n=1 Tax=Natrarchaeobius halalkaliphilus TaxID=1679091 RepID=A0A3N6NZ02_9EURY|nr:hypothetical protein [Natrarchaeobius halalkaliphilus]RQG90119.1 hypothetical protein EA462_09000 [Natrarchaeobius halalkaliphilus]
MSRYGPRIAALERRALRERASLDAADLESDEATRFLRDGAGQAIWLYVEGRTGGRMVRFPPAEMRALECAMNAWLECYTRCYGVELDAEFTVREAAELLLETHNIVDVAQLLTGVPSRECQSSRDAVDTTT